MPTTTQVADENDSYDIANFIRAGNQTRETRRYLESFFNGGDHRIYVTWTKCLLYRDEEWQ